MQINQQQIAEQLKLSQTTVSRALSNHPAIKAQTKAMVWELAAQMGYQVPPSKSRLSGNSNEPMIIGVLISIPKRQRGYGEASQLVLRGITERSSRDVVTLDVMYHEPSEQSASDIQKRIRQSRWKGVILVYPMALPLVDQISKTIPSVSVIENYRKSHVDSVDVDQAEAVNLLVRQLNKVGHEKIGFLSWVYDVPTPWVYHRFGAYVESLFMQGLPFDRSNILNVTKGESLSADEVADKVVDCIRNGTTAFMCAADHQAYKLQELLEKRGIKVPEDCSLTGFDGIDPPPGQDQLATVKVPYDEIGRSAFHQLIRRIEQPTAPRRHVVVDGNFLPGSSISSI